jgi:Zn-dependent M28 family amino/carboxypeptidase
MTISRLYSSLLPVFEELEPRLLLDGALYGLELLNTHTALSGNVATAQAVQVEADQFIPSHIYETYSGERVDLIRALLDSITTTGSTVELSQPAEYIYAGETPIEPDTNWSGPLINLDDYYADPRFTAADGSGFAVAVLDTGIDLNHSYFGPDGDSNGVADRIVFSYDFADGDADASDNNDHGSNVASIVGSENGTYTGVAPGVDIVALKVFTDGGSGNFGYVEDALQWVVANAAAYNIVSINMSLGDGGNYQSNQQLYGVWDEMAALAAMDVAVVTSAGNAFYTYSSAMGVAYPAADPNSLAIGAVYDGNSGGWGYSSGATAYSTSADAITPFSQRDTTLTEIFAPGAPITGANANGGTVTMHGTSQASPQIAGIVALAQDVANQELGRSLTITELENLLTSTAVPIFDGDDGDGGTVDENDNVTNTGETFLRVDVFAMAEAIVAMAGNQSPTGVPDDYQVDEEGSLSVPALGVLDNDTDPEDDPLEAVLVDDALEGDLTLNLDGSFTYDPDPNFGGQDTFTYRATDGETFSDVTTVTITVDRSNDGGPTLSSPITDLNVDEDAADTVIDLATVFSDPDVGFDGDFLTYTISYNTSTTSIVDRISEAAYTSHHQDRLYTHTGDNRGFGTEHDLARDNIQAWFESLGLTTSLDAFSYSSSTYYNVVGELTGVTNPDEIYIIGAHYDSVDNPGADDNASGTAAVMEAARVLSNYQFDATIRFITFDREEQGLYGSSAYAAAAALAGENILGMVNLDMIAYNPGGLDQVRLYEYLDAWSTSSYIGTQYGSDYVQDGDTGKGSKSVIYTPDLAASGSYEVFIWYPSYGTLATNVPVDIVYDGGSTTVTVNQQTGGGGWESLGVYAFAAGTSASVTVRTTDTDGYVVADAVKFTQTGASPTEVILDNGDASVTLATSSSVRLDLDAAFNSYGNGVDAVIAGTNGQSDHKPFEENGYDAVLIIEYEVWNNPHYHQQTDAVETSNYIDYTFATNVTSAATGYLADFAAIANATSLLTVGIDGESLTLDYADNQSGIVEITIRATDQSGLWVEDTFEVTVNAVDDDPVVVTPIEGVTVAVNAASTTIDLTARFDDADILTDGDWLTYSVSGNTNPGLVAPTIAGSELTLDYLPDQSGTSDVAIRATDSLGNWVEDVFTVTVDPDLVEDPTEVILDNGDAGVVEVGEWRSSTFLGTRYGADYRHDRNTDKGSKSVSYTPELTASGSYEVFIWYPAYGTLATNVPVDIVYDGGSTTATVNQQTGGGGWESLGTYTFAAGTSGNVTVRTTDTDGYVVVDAVKFTPVTGQVAPVSNDDGYTTEPDTALNVNALTGVLANDVDGNGDPMTADLVSDVSNGTLTLNADGSFDYTPDGGFTGDDTFTYRAYDGTDYGNTATVTISVTATVATEVILDNGDAGVVESGVWTTSTFLGTRYGADYRHDRNTDKGSKSVSYTPELTASGSYEVFIWYPAYGTLATNVPVDIVYDGGSTTTTVNQQTGGGGWESLGTYTFAAGTSGNVTVRTTDTDGYVVVDAVKFTPVVVAPVAYTVPDAALLGAEFDVAWGTSTLDKTQNGSDVDFEIVLEDETGIGDPWPIASELNFDWDPVLSHYTSVDNYDSYEMSFTYVSGPGDITLRAYLNTGLVGPSGYPSNDLTNDTWWGGVAETVSVGETVTATLNFDSAQAYNITDNTDPHTAYDDPGRYEGMWTAINTRDRYEVDNIGFVVDFVNGADYGGTVLLRI